METPVLSSALRVAPLSVFHHVFLISPLLIVPTVMLFAVWMGGRTTALAWIAPLLWVGCMGTAFVLFTRRMQGPVYWLDTNGISFLDRDRHVIQSLAWSEIVEIRSGSQDDLFLYTSGRERVVKITPNLQNYRQSAPLLAEHLSPLWRDMTKTVRDKTIGTYLVLLLGIVYVSFGVMILIKGSYPIWLYLPMGLFLAYQQSKRVRRIEFTSDGLALTKFYGRDLISASAIHAIELKHIGRGKMPAVVLKLKDSRTILLYGFTLDPISVYCIVAVWQRDQLAGRT